MTTFIDERKVDEYLTRLRQGDSSALDPLYEASSKQLYSICYSYLHDPHDSADALSDTYLAIVKNIDKFRGDNGYNWIYTIAKNTSLNIIREKKKTISVDFNDEETVNVLHLESEDAPKIEDESGVVAIAKRVLNEKEFRVFVLHAINGLKFKEIAKLVGGLESSIRWQYNNSLKKIKNAYERRNAE